MQRHVTVAILLLVSAVPGRAQFEHLIRQGQGLSIPEERKVTLSLSRVAVKDAVAKLAEAAQTALACAPTLAGRKVSLSAREGSARQVADALARAVRARWRQEGEGFLLEPVDPLDVLTGEEAVRQVKAALLQPGAAPAKTAEEVGGRILELFTREQLQAIGTEEGIAFTALAPEQQQVLLSIFAREGMDALGSLAALHRQAGRMSEVVVSTYRSESEMTSVSSNSPTPVRKKVTQENLMVRGPGWTRSVTLRRVEQDP